MNRRLRYMHDALGHVQQVDGMADEIKKIYGGFCHELPILVRQDGLAQTVAFIEDKAGGYDLRERTPTNEPRKRAFRQIRNHVAATFGVNGDDECALVDHVHGAHLPQYMRDTTAILEAWIFYKRFAVSILDVEAGQDTREE